MTEQAKLRADIDQLQTKLAFQEHTIEELNLALSDQQQQMEKMQFQIKHLIDRVKQLQPSQIASQSEETPPPHY